MIHHLLSQDLTGNLTHLGQNKTKHTFPNSLPRFLNNYLPLRESSKIQAFCKFLVKNILITLRKSIDSSLGCFLSLCQEMKLKHYSRTVYVISYIKEEAGMLKLWTNRLGIYISTLSLLAKETSIRFRTSNLESPLL